MLADYFMKFDGVDGEVKDPDYKGFIQLESFRFGTTATAGSGSRPGQTKIVDVHFTMRVNRASPALFMACATGTPFPKAVLCARKAGGGQQEYARWTFANVLIASFTTSGHGSGDELPMEAATCSFDKLEAQYREQKADGSLGPPVKTSYDLKTAK